MNHLHEPYRLLAYIPANTPDVADTPTNIIPFPTQSERWLRKHTQPMPPRPTTGGEAA